MAAIILFAQQPRAKERWIAVTPTGVVEYRGARKGIVVAAAYSNLARVALPENSRSGVLVLVFKRSPGAPAPYRWIISESFGVRSHIAQLIIEAFTRYVARTTPVAESHF